MNHVIECKLTQIKFLRLNELFFEGLDISDHTNTSALIEISWFVDPHALAVIIHEIYLVRHQVKPICFRDELVNSWRHFLALLLELQL